MTASQNRGGALIIVFILVVVLAKSHTPPAPNICGEAQGKFLSLSVPQFPHLENEDDESSFIGLLLE